MPKGWVEVGVTDSAYRRVMFTAFSVPAGLFLVLPLFVVLLIAPSDRGNLMWVIAAALAILAPAYVTGYLMAPWSGRRLPRTKAPAFFMAAIAAASSALAAGLLSLASGSTEVAIGHGLAFAFFALPASVIGSLLFIGGCERGRGIP